jgi:hypothetical protein
MTPQFSISKGRRLIFNILFPKEKRMKKELNFIVLKLKN